MLQTEGGKRINKFEINTLTLHTNTFFFSIMNSCIRARGTTVACANIKMYPIYNSAAVAGSVYIKVNVHE